MTEKEKMLNGENYNARDPELLKMAQEARYYMDEFNKPGNHPDGDKTSILKNLCEFVGENVWIEKPFFCDYGKNISIGKNTFINFNCVFLDTNKIVIGENVLIAPSVQIYTATHPLKADERINSNHKPNEAPYRTLTKPVTIGDNVWIGGNAIILPGVTIGNNSVIGAGSVVTKSIPENSLAIGNPCRVVKEI
ncbi:sugar O-acetyltransferase [Priestia flexa]|uniref:sugar O-acetyltransferase n=1 Tax=Priestia flexa TaxID=86664 RepID=UPI0021FB22BA|nr:sugar O-acetyltransferase [Priestia flexa]MDT2045913.1 sugar O-acetyltransferase [Priestia flexa]USY54047.1 sugar O-acetyltransferase [Bacillus sp. 1780r2a1]